MSEKSHKADKIGTLSMGRDTLCDEMLDDAAFAARDEAWAALVGLFDDLAERNEISYGTLAERIGRSKSQVHRWLHSSSNVTLKSLGLLAAGMNADVQVTLCPVSLEVYGGNEYHPADAAAASIEFDSWRIGHYSGEVTNGGSARKIVTQSSVREVTH